MREATAPQQHEQEGGRMLRAMNRQARRERHTVAMSELFEVFPKDGCDSDGSCRATGTDLLLSRGRLEAPITMSERGEGHKRSTGDGASAERGGALVQSKR